MGNPERFTGDFFDGRDDLRKKRERRTPYEEGQAAIDRSRRILNKGKSEREIEKTRRDLAEKNESRRRKQRVG